MAMVASAPCLLLAFSMLIATVSAHSSSAMAPAFIWSNLRCVDSGQQVNYQVSDARSVTRAALEQLDMKKCLDESEKPADLLVAFVGSEVRSVELSNELSSYTVEKLKGLILASNSSLSFPYVAAADGISIGSDVVRTLQDSTDLVAAFGCPGTLSSLSVLEAENYVVSTKAEHAQVLLLCLSSSALEPEGQVVQRILSKLEESSVRYVALYASDPLGFESFYASKHRMLASNDTKPYCDDVCKTKATLLEAIFVVIVLLMILISGLCCMMGIQTPLRFEKPHES
ncbi:hypothetical protein SELMODRAFT_228107 [Selaginella moellendorffii]|uniref:V-type proton ATPase subunit S1/VOA1 transmembrane domain-containing protein n=1 Tax=Selaginella moellendorffii TaxID=88036 RepID=D8RMG8_SELML|nr:uncharacterized protein LOC9651055 [Selaginella moellendorffii]XP_024533002.1 uncharacterized protein LOC9651055 [Selaginella moellendorffii]EFJ26337.1 hypothetical protein SELMODRAFT_228107 [Selaginella moellendorffii]|eukprot:XP_002972251.1 uncharacterized protein LOC9651055 [Selaginella moellendorffii]